MKTIVRNFKRSDDTVMDASPGMLSRTKACFMFPSHTNFVSCGIYGETIKEGTPCPVLALPKQALNHDSDIQFLDA